MASSIARMSAWFLVMCVVFPTNHATLRGEQDLVDAIHGSRAHAHPGLREAERQRAAYRNSDEHNELVRQRNAEQDVKHAENMVYAEQEGAKRREENQNEARRQQERVQQFREQKLERSQQEQESLRQARYNADKRNDPNEGYFYPGRQSGPAPATPAPTPFSDIAGFNGPLHDMTFRTCAYMSMFFMEPGGVQACADECKRNSHQSLHKPRCQGFVFAGAMRCCHSQESATTPFQHGSLGKINIVTYTKQKVEVEEVLQPPGGPPLEQEEPERNVAGDILMGAVGKGWLWNS